MKIDYEFFIHTSTSVEGLAVLLTSFRNGKTDCFNSNNCLIYTNVRYANYVVVCAVQYM